MDFCKKNMKSSFKNIAVLFFLGGAVFAQNQNKLFSEYGDGSYTTYKVEKEKFEKVSKQWPVTIQAGSNKDFDGNLIVESVIISRQGVIKENFVPDIAENPVYFGYKNFRLSVINDKIYYYEWSNDNSTISYILTKGGTSSYSSEKETLEKFVREAFKNQQSAKGKLADVKVVNSKKEAEENSLKGKTIKSIEIQMIDVPKELGVKSTVKFGAKVTTSDGKMFSTTNIGGKTTWDDFIIKTSDGVFVDEAIEIHEDASKITNDELKFTVASKYSPAVTAQKVFPLNYEAKQYQIKTGAKYDNAVQGGTGVSLTLKIQKAVTKNTNLPIYKVEVIESLTGKVIGKIKLSQTAVINVNVFGGNGRIGSDTRTEGRRAGNGDDGYNGGNVTVYKAADITGLGLNIINNGGKGGKGGNGVSAFNNGANGKEGKTGEIINNTLTGNLDW